MFEVGKLKEEVRLLRQISDQQTKTILAQDEVNKKLFEAVQLLSQSHKELLNALTTNL
jgi:hypothetical protein